MNDFVDFLWKLLENVLVAVLPILATALTVWLIQKIREIGKGINADTMKWIVLAATIAVNAAEQADLAGLIEDRKTYALTIAQEYLDKQGIKADISLLAGIIEAAVMTEFNQHKLNNQHKLTK